MDLHPVGPRHAATIERKRPERLTGLSLRALVKAMMFEELGWDDVARTIVRGLEGAIAAQRVTYDLARQLPGTTEVSTSAFADAIIEHLS